MKDNADSMYGNFDDWAAGKKVGKKVRGIFIRNMNQEFLNRNIPCKIDLKTGAVLFQGGRVKIYGASCIIMDEKEIEE